jgi:hypothetical protein
MEHVESRRKIAVRVRWLLMAAGLLALTGGVALMFHAGCVGDTKSGDTGDPVAALRAESFSLMVGLSGCLLIAASVSIFSGGSASRRIAQGTTALIVAFIILEFGGIQAEVSGVQYCLKGAREHTVRQPVLPASRLTKSEFQKWINESFSAGAPIRFFSSNGVRMCCEYPNVSVELLPGQKMLVAVDGWGTKQYTASYSVEDDGTIDLTPGSVDFPADTNRIRVTKLYVVRNESDTFLLVGGKQASDHPGLDSLWPLVFISNGDWRPPPVQK